MSRSIELSFFVMLVGMVSCRASCEQGYVLDSSQVCVRAYYIQGCFRYASARTCQTCHYNYRLNSEAKCDFDGNGQPCCLEVVADTCTKCNVGLWKIDGECVGGKIIGCLEQNQGKCVNCDLSYKLSEGKCQQLLPWCKAYQDSTRTICAQCQPGHSLINNLCIANPILGCQQQNDLVCEACYPPFRQNGTHCEIQACATYNEYGCTACECGYYLNEDRVCQQMMLGCMRYERGVCTDCMEHFVFRGGVCVIEHCVETDGLDCEQCQEGYDKWKGKCQLGGCQLQVPGEETCRKCRQNYKLSDDRCMPLLHNQHGGLRRID